MANTKFHKKKKIDNFPAGFFHNFRSNYEKILQIFAHAAGSCLKERERRKGIYRQGVGSDFRRKPSTKAETDTMCFFGGI